MSSTPGSPVKVVDSLGGNERNVFIVYLSVDTRCSRVNTTSSV